MKDSIWHTEADLRGPDTPWSGTAPIAIIGAGIAGIATAYWLARDHGVHAAVYERHRLAEGASGRSAGFLLIGPADYYDAAVARWGRDQARVIWRFSVENRALFLTTIQDEAIDAGWAPTGHLYMADDEAEAASLEASHAMLVEDGFPSQLWDHTACRAASGSARFGPGRYTPGDGRFHPARAVGALAAAARGRGARVYTDCAVTHLTPRAGGWRLTTHRGPVAAETVVLAAAGPAIGRLWPPAAPHLTSVRAQMLATEPCDLGISLPLATRRGETYWRQRGDGRLVVGGERRAAPDAEIGCVEAAPGGPVQAALERFLADTYPATSWRVARRWAGIMTYTASGLPWVGPAPGGERLYVATGWAGHGFAFAWFAGRRLAAAIAARDGAPAVPWPIPTT